MMRRRGGTNKLKTPRSDKYLGQGRIKRKVPSSTTSGDIASGSGSATAEHASDAGIISENVGASRSISIQIPGPSLSVRQTDSSSDFVFKRPKTPPPKNLRKSASSSSSSGGSAPESRRIRSKLKPGKTGFPIGASIHGLSRSEKLERRSKGKSRTNSGVFPEASQSSSYHQNEERITEDAFTRQPVFPTDGRRQEQIEQVISYPRQTVTKLKFPPPRQRSASEKRSKKPESLVDQQGVKESLEICQGFSKIKLEDWYPLFDFHHSKRNASNVDISTSANKSTSEANEKDDDDDEWEESLVYVDLEDIPDVDGLFSSLSARRRMNSNSREEAENIENCPLSHLEMKIFNLDSDLPVLLLGGKYLAGHWENSCGTSLFFKKSESEEDSNYSSTSTLQADKPKLKSIVPEVEIPYDPIFGKNYGTPEGGYELVAKSMKVLKARYFPVVNEELKGEDVIRDADDEFDHRDFQIPPVNMVREFMPTNLTYDEYVERDIERRRNIRKVWKKEEDVTQEGEADDATNIVKTEPLDRDDDEYTSDSEDLDSILIINRDENEPIPCTSKSINN